MTYLLFFVVFLSDVVWLLVFLFYDVLAIAFLYDNVCLCILCRFAIFTDDVYLLFYTVILFLFLSDDVFPILVWRFGHCILSDDV